MIDGQLSPEALAPMCAYWQRQLRCQDWTVTAGFAPARDMGDAVGRCHIRVGTGDATIQLLDPSEHSPHHDERDRDWELTLVHELLHVMIPADDDNGECSARQEVAVESVARALVNLNRGIRK